MKHNKVTNICCIVNFLFFNAALGGSHKMLQLGVLKIHNN